MSPTMRSFNLNLAEDRMNQEIEELARMLGDDLPINLHNEINDLPDHYNTNVEQSCQSDDESSCDSDSDSCTSSDYTNSSNCSDYDSDCSSSFDCCDRTSDSHCNADICFPANTPIKTDQGIISIDNLDIKNHTIDKKAIVEITKTKISGKFLVSIDTNALGPNCPSHKTIMTKEHHVKYNGEMVEAGSLVGNFDGVTTVPYNGEILYNILMDQHETISVNNIICETLHPATYLGIKLFNNKVPKEYKLLKETLNLFKKIQ